LKQPEDDAEEIALRDQIEQIILEFAGYGYRRVTHALARQGCESITNVCCGSCEESLLCHLKKRFVIATPIRGIAFRSIQCAGRDHVECS